MVAGARTLPKPPYLLEQGYEHVRTISALEVVGTAVLILLHSNQSDSARKTTAVVLCSNRNRQNNQQRDINRLSKSILAPRQTVCCHQNTDSMNCRPGIGCRTMKATMGEKHEEQHTVVSLANSSIMVREDQYRWLFERDHRSASAHIEQLCRADCCTQRHHVL